MPVIGGQEDDVGGVVAADAVVSVNVLNEGATNREAAARLLDSRHTTDFHLTHCLMGQAHAAPW